MKKILKYKNYFIAFIIPALIMFYCFTFNKVGINQKYSILMSDLMAQYAPTIEYLGNGGNLIYSFSSGLGTSMFGIFAYFACSPLNLLSLIIKDSNTLVYILVILRFGLCGLTSYAYLRKHYKEDNKIYLLFSSIYALCGFMTLYYHLIIWFDTLILFPLVILGLERLIKENKKVLYIITLTLTMMVNYYMSYIVCLFLCLYFVYELVINYKKCDKKLILQIIKRFIISSIIAALIASIILVPVALDIINCQKVGSDLYIATEKSSNILKLLGRFFIASSNKDNFLNQNLPLVYTSILSLPLMYFYFRSKSFTLKEKIASISFILVMCLPFFIPIINKLWHGLNYPMWLNYRFSFTLSFLFILISIKAYKNVDNIKLKDYIIFLVVFLLISALLLIKKQDFLSTKSIIISICFLVTYLVLLYFKKENKLLEYLLFFIVLIELFLNAFLIYKDYEFTTNLELDTNSQVNNNISKYNPKENEFYRSDKTFRLITNESLNNGNYGMSLFVSNYKSNLYTFLDRIGTTATGNVNTIYTNGVTPLINSILNFKYILTEDDNITFYNHLYNNLGNYMYSMYSSIKDEYARTNISEYYNDNYLSLGFMVNDDIKKLKFKNNENSLDYQNDILSKMLGEDTNIFNEINEENEKYHLNNDIYYLYIDKYIKKGNINILINGKKAIKIDKTSPKIIPIPVEFYNQDITITYKSKNKKNKLKDIKVYEFDNNLFNDKIQALKENMLNIEKVKDNYIKGKINVSKNKTLFTSIPYDKGWKVFVDKREVKYYELLDSFIGIDLEEGKHTIEFKYSLPGLKVGIIISIIGILCLIIYVEYDKKQKQ